MLTTLQIVTLMLVALAMVPAAAHALELPGKMRLSREIYLAVQRIYYPGFTVAGFAEVFSMIAALALVFITPRESAAFGLSLGALVLLLAMHAIYWGITAPVNKIWLKGERLSKTGETFFRVNDDADELPPAEWTSLRNRWEYSHVLRAVLVTIALALLASALAIS